MRLIGMLDSPFVRRTAVCLEHLQVQFHHEPVSVFSNFEQFRSINPLVKAPTVVCDDGTVLMDSTLILQYAEASLTARSLWGHDADQLAHEYRGVALAMVAAEKCAQLIYEQNLRPAQARFAPWMQRLTGQFLSAYAALERELPTHPRIYARDDGHAPIFAAIAWQFSHSMLPVELPEGSFPGLVQLSQRMERSEQFRKYPPDGPGVVAPT
ncbi:MAG: glutathione S-transferase family protein [Pseudomonadota bacterium]